jgi:NADH dehydrogenase FAD-containing subunit
MESKARPKVVVLGGGFAGLEAALFARMRMPEEAEIVLVSDKDHFLFKPNMIYIPFGLEPHKLKLGLTRPTRHKNIKFVQASAIEIDPISRYVGLESYDYCYKLSYDYLVVATGARMRGDAVPGLSDFAHTIWTPEEMLRLRSGFQKVMSNAQNMGKFDNKQRVLFLIPPGNKHSGPIYEMAMMLDTWLRRKKVRENVEVTLTTFEESYIQAFGPRLDEVVRREFNERGITGHTGYSVDSVEAGKVFYRNGETGEMPFDLLVSSPPYIASTRFGSLPVDKQGFIATNLESRQVAGYPNVYAVGDTADFPVKQAHLAVGQADAAADHLSAQILGTEPQVRFEPTGMYVIDGLDRATFVQAPLHLTGRLDRPVQAQNEDDDSYRVGSSPVWRLGKLAIGIYLPWRFKAGNPFHAGAPWKSMEAAMKLMSGLMAR